MHDLIDRQAAIDTLDKHLRTTDVPVSYPGIISALTEWLNELPSAQADMSEYSDKLWKAAYERGKAEAQAEIVRCKDCKHYKFADNRAFGFPVKRCEWTGFEDVDNDDFCSRAERRTDE